MTISVTPIFIPGLILTRDIFAAQIDGLVHPAAAKTADTLGRDSITAMAEAALPFWGGLVMDVAILLNGLGVCASYMIVATDSFVEVTASRRCSDEFPRAIDGALR